MVSMHTDECRVLGAPDQDRQHVSIDRVPTQPSYPPPQVGPGPHVVVRHMQLHMTLLSSCCAGDWWAVLIEYVRVTISDACI